MSTDHQIASVDGEITPAGEARLPLPDDGLFRGDGVFEVIRTYGGRPFALGEHLDRMDRSAAKVSLTVDREPLERELDAVLEQVGDDRLIRIVVTRGGRRLIFTEPMPEHAPTLSLAVVRYSPTVILDGVKSISYVANMEATRAAKRAGADDALLVTPGDTVLEAPTSTIFWVKHGVLKTPSLDCSILDSITRRWIVAEAEVAEGRYELADLLGADEAFLASTTREVHPIDRIDDTRLETPGPVSQSVQRAFSAALERGLS